MPSELQSKIEQALVRSAKLDAQRITEPHHDCL
jgi:hypothetical protein